MRILAIYESKADVASLEAAIARGLPEARLLAASGGQEGLELARAEDPDLVLLDTATPGLDACAVCREIKEDERLRDIPVLFQASFPIDRDVRVKALEAGADGLLSKPLDEAELAAQIRAMVKVKAANRLHRLEDKGLAGLVAARTRELEEEMAGHKRAEETLRTNEERFEHVANASHDALYDWDLLANTAWLSEAHERLFGYTDVHASYDWWQERIHPADRASTVDSMMAVLDGGGPSWTCEYRFRRADGSYAHVFDRGQVLRDPQGRPVRLIGAMMDITERRRAEDELRNAEERFRTFFDNAPIGKCMTAPDGTLLRVNPALCSMLGYTAEELQSRTFASITHPEDLAESCECVRSLLAGERDTWDMENRCVTCDGQVVWTRVTTRLQRDQEGKPLHFLTHVQDITQRKQAEAERERLIVELRRAEIKTLKGFVPICAGCKKIRDDHGFWTQVETYITRHSEATFSHSLCPDCLRKYYPDFANEESDL